MEQQAAFPVNTSDNAYIPGMDLRDYFAGQALCGILLYVTRHQPKPNEVAVMSYRMADAMIAARENKS